jgi:hypothetical protein
VNSLITDVARGVHVPVETDAAVAAFEDAITESELGFRLAAVRAHLRRGKILIYDNDTVSAVFRFADELTTQLIESGVENRS